MAFKIPGLSYSWKRATRITGARQRIARRTGIPTTRTGLERKLGSVIVGLIMGLLLGKRK